MAYVHRLQYISILDATERGHQLQSVTVTTISAHLRYHFPPLPPIDNPITTPGVDQTKCMNTSTNDQFRYETEKELELQLRQDYGKVSSNLILILELPVTITD